MLTPSLYRPRALPILDPTFADFVVYHLPREEFQKGNTLNRDNTLPPSSKNSIFDEYHYNLLLEGEMCKEAELNRTWRDWKEMGKYEHGEEFRQKLAIELIELKPYLDFFETIKEGMDGMGKDMGIFYLKWRTQGMKEAARDKDWKTWTEVWRMNETRFRPISGCLSKNPEECRHIGAEGCLGKKIYR
jgi:hypothetical protein